eukprot:3080177-Pyramimonas_sp.AAC.1
MYTHSDSRWGAGERGATYSSTPERSVHTAALKPRAHLCTVAALGQGGPLGPWAMSAFRANLQIRVPTTVLARRGGGAYTRISSAKRQVPRPPAHVSMHSHI